MYKDLSDMGIAFELDPQDFPDWGIRSAYLRDPDGNRLELHSALDRSKWSEGLTEAAREQEDR